MNTDDAMRNLEVIQKQMTAALIRAEAAEQKLERVRKLLEEWRTQSWPGFASRMLIDALGDDK